MKGLAEKALQFRHNRRHYRVIVIGVGDAGNNTINHLMDMGVTGIDCIAINTDMQKLNATRATQKVLIGEEIERGLGSGDPEVGLAAIEESRKQVEDVLSNVDAAFVTTGLGGGTGTGAALVVAEIARRRGAIVIGVVTMPFEVEKEKIEYAAQGLDEMRKRCDTVVMIDNSKFRHLASQVSPIEVFKIADQMLADTINGIIEALLWPSLINLDCSNFEAIMRKGGVAVVGVGESDAPDRAQKAVRNALRSPTLDVDCSNAKGALIQVTGDDQMTIEEANSVGKIVSEMMHENALVSWGAKVNPSLPGILRVTLVMTGIQSPYLSSGFGKIAPSLYNMDLQAEPEKPLKIDLGLHQLDDF